MTLETYYCWVPSYDESESDASPIKAFDHEDAAERHAERDDWESAEFLIIGGNSADIHVKDAKGVKKVFFVSGESVPAYHAKEIKG